MLLRLRTLVLLTCCTITGLLQSTVQAQTAFPLPAFSVTTTDGKLIDSTFYRGNLTWINFFYMGCAPCMKEIPLLIRLQQYFGKQQLRIIGIAPHAPSQLETFIRQKKEQGLVFNYPLAGECPEDGNTSTAPRCHPVSGRLGVTSYPTSILVDATGNMVMTIEGFPIREKDEETFGELVKLVEGFLRTSR